MAENAPLTIRLNGDDNVVVARTEILPGTEIPGEGVAAPDAAELAADSVPTSSLRRMPISNSPRPSS